MFRKLSELSRERAWVSEPAAHSLTKVKIWRILLTLAHGDLNFKSLGSLTHGSLTDFLWAVKFNFFEFPAHFFFAKVPRLPLNPVKISHFLTICVLWVLSSLRTTIFREILVVTYLVTIPVNVVGTFTNTWQIICPVNFAINGLASRNIKNEAMLLLKNKNLIYFHAELFSTLLVFLNSASFCEKLPTYWSNNTKG